MKIDKDKFEIYLAKRKLLINEFCNVAGVTKTSLNLALKGKRKSRPKTVGRIAEALGVAVEDIILKEGE